MILRRPGSDLNLIEVRTALRGSYVHDLRTYRQVPVHFNKPGTFELPDVATLALFEALSINFYNARATARQRYEELRRDDDLPWSELAERGWTWPSVGRVWLTATGLRELAEHGMPALAELHESFSRNIHCCGEHAGRADLAAHSNLDASPSLTVKLAT